MLRGCQADLLKWKSVFLNSTVSSGIYCVDGLGNGFLNTVFIPEPGGARQIRGIGMFANEPGTSC